MKFVPFAFVAFVFVLIGNMVARVPQHERPPASRFIASDQKVFEPEVWRAGPKFND